MNKQHPATLLILLTIVCAAADAQDADPLRTAAPKPLFTDLEFRRGFHLSYPDASKGRSVEAVLDLGDAANQPVWRLCQWASNYTFADLPCVRHTNGDRSYENKGKRIVVGTEKSENRDLILDVRGTAEYGGRAREFGEPWPHLLVEQDAVVTYPLNRLAAIRFRASVRLIDFKECMEVEHKPSLHAAQFQAFLIVKNVNPASGDYRDFFWFGIPFFDNRHEIPPAYMARDVGKDDATGKFIYTIDGARILSHPVLNGEWVHVRENLLPHIQEGLKEAAARGYLSTADPQDYAVVNMNMGWEMPGIFDAAMQVRGLGVDVVVKSNSRS